MSEEQLYHVPLTLVANGKGTLKLVSEVQSSHARLTLVAVGNGVLNEVSPLCRHALLKFTLVASVPSFAPAGNDVRDEQYCHAEPKLLQLGISVVPNELSEPEELHALSTSTALVKSRLGKLVSEPIWCQV